MKNGASAKSRSRSAFGSLVSSRPVGTSGNSEKRVVRPNMISGRIDNVEYGGRDALLDIVTPSGTLVHARGPVTLKRGDEVSVHVPVERALVYPAE